MRFWKPKDLSRDLKVSMQVASFLNGEARQLEALLCLLYSFRAQTHKRWEAIVTHDGPITDPAVRDAITSVKDKRIKLIETAEHKHHFGHPHRHWAITTHATGDVVGFTNQDNYYVPSYFSWMLSEMEEKRADFVYCDMVHSHTRWHFFPTKPKYKHLDLGGWLATASLVRATPWTDYSFSGDGAYINALVRKAKRVAKVGACLFVHN